MTLFLKRHQEFTLKPNLCRWPERGWSLWWLWFEIAAIPQETPNNG